MNSPMNFDIFLFNLTTISAYFTPVDLDILPTNFSLFVDNSIVILCDLCRTISENLFCPIEFTELQTILLTIFLVILSINLALIGFYWSKYGGVITDRFIRPSKRIINTFARDDSSLANEFLIIISCLLIFVTSRFLLILFYLIFYIPIPLCRHFEGNWGAETVGGETKTATRAHATNLSQFSSHYYYSPIEPI